LDSEKFIKPQKDYADLVIRYLAGETGGSAEIAGLEFGMDNSADTFSLIAGLKEISTLVVKQEADLEKQTWTLAGTITAEQVAEIAKKNFPEVLKQSSPRWKKDSAGLVMLVMLVELNELRQRRADE